jgi:hypothetical protein
MSNVRRRRTNLGQSFIMHPREMRESPAWLALPDNARRILDRLEVEHMRHGGGENGKLPCTYTDFHNWGIRRASVALAIRQCVALGFLEVTRPGFRSSAEFHHPSLYRLTYISGCGISPAPTDDWRRIKTDEAAKEALNRAAASRRHETQPKRNTSRAAPPHNIERRRANEP